MTAPTTAACPDGPQLALCKGTRCAALWRLARTDGHLARTVAGTPGAVLLVTDCLGPCHLGAVALLARRDGRTGSSGPTLWLAGVQGRARHEALKTWLSFGGPALRHDTVQDLPADLAAAVIGRGPALGAPRPIE